MLTPMRVNALQQHHALKLNKVFFANLRKFVCKRRVGSGNDFFQNVFVGHRGCALDILDQGQINLPFIPQYFFQPGDIPLFLNAFNRHILARQICKAAFSQRCNLPRQAGGIHDVIALLVDHFALVVGHVIVFKQLFARVKVARLDLTLRRLNAA